MESLNSTLGVILMIIVGVSVFMFLVIIHELGHFWAAKKSGVKVLEFGVGIPPKACTLWTDKSGTEYTLNWIPLGGFVRLKGEDPKHEEDFNAKDSFISAHIIKKIIIILGGVTMNFIFARLIFTVVFWVGTQPITIVPENAVSIENTSYLTPTAKFLNQNGFLSGDINQSVEVLAVDKGGLGYSIGLQSGAYIISLNQEKINLINLTSLLKANIDKTFDIQYTFNDQIFDKTLTCPSDGCQLGIIIAGPQVKPIKFPLTTAMIVSLQELKAQTNITLNSLSKIGKGLASFEKSKIKGSIDKLSGPVGITKIIGQLFVEKQWTMLMGLAGLISFALVIFNLLPIPALDGGRGLSILIQWIGRFKAEKYFVIEGYINLVVFVLLLVLGVYIMLKDLVHIRLVKIPFIG